MNLSKELNIKQVLDIKNTILSNNLKFVPHFLIHTLLGFLSGSLKVYWIIEYS